MIKPVCFTFLLASLSGLSLPAAAQEELSQHWNGEWIADGTLFQIAVSVEGDVMRVQQVESLGFVWTSEDGKVDGNIAQVKVEYAGVTGIIQAELVDPDTATVFAATCVPEFMVVCALAKDRQAIFKRVPAN